MLGRRHGVLGSRPRGLDLFNEVPQDERRDAGIAATEDRVAVIKKSLNSGVNVASMFAMQET